MPTDDFHMESSFYIMICRINPIEQAYDDFQYSNIVTHNARSLEKKDINVPQILPCLRIP